MAKKSNRTFGFTTKMVQQIAKVHELEWDLDFRVRANLSATFAGMEPDVSIARPTSELPAAGTVQKLSIGVQPADTLPTEKPKLEKLQGHGHNWTCEKHGACKCKHTEGEICANRTVKTTFNFGEVSPKTTMIILMVTTGHHLT